MRREWLLTSETFILQGKVMNHHIIERSEGKWQLKGEGNQYESVVADTQKKAMHGIGIKNVKKIVAKYKGAYDMECEDDEVVTTVTMLYKQRKIVENRLLTPNLDYFLLLITKKSIKYTKKSILSFFTNFSAIICVGNRNEKIVWRKREK